MHELSVCYGLLSQVERVAREHAATGVTRILLQVGPLSGVEPRLLRRAWPVAAAASVAANATLDIEAADIRVRCSRCDAESAATANRLLCNTCGDYRTRVISGDELILKTLELETARVPRNTDAGQEHRRIHGAL